MANNEVLIDIKGKVRDLLNRTRAAQKTLDDIGKTATNVNKRQTAEVKRQTASYRTLESAMKRVAAVNRKILRIGLAVTGLGAARGLLRSMINTLDESADNFSRSRERLKTAITEVLNPVADALSNVIDFMAILIQTTDDATGATDSLNDQMDKYAEWFKKNRKPIITFWVALSTAIRNVSTSVELAVLKLQELAEAKTGALGGLSDLVTKPGIVAGKGLATGKGLKGIGQEVANAMTERLQRGVRIKELENILSKSATEQQKILTEAFKRFDKFERPEEDEEEEKRKLGKASRAFIDGIKTTFSGNTFKAPGKSVAGTRVGLEQLAKVIEQGSAEASAKETAKNTKQMNERLKNIKDNLNDGVNGIKEIPNAIRELNLTQQPPLVA